MGEAHHATRTRGPGEAHSEARALDLMIWSVRGSRNRVCVRNMLARPSLVFVQECSVPKEMAFVSVRGDLRYSMSANGSGSEVW